MCGTRGIVQPYMLVDIAREHINTLDKYITQPSYGRSPLAECCHRDNPQQQQQQQQKKRLII